MDSDVTNFKKNYLWSFIVEERNRNVTLRHFAKSKMRLDTAMIMMTYKTKDIEKMA